MHLFAIVLVLLIGGTFVGVAISGAIRCQHKTGKQWWVEATGLILVALGGAGFFGIAFSAVGGLSWLPLSFEWPVGSATGILMLPDGKHVVPVQAPDRIQVYAPDWKFLKGWYLDAHAGWFDIRPAGTDKIEVRTARGQLRYLYDLDGTMLSRGTYALGAYDNSPAAGGFAKVPTPWWLWMLTSPAHSWIVAAVGGALVYLSTRRKGRANDAG